MWSYTITFSSRFTIWDLIVSVPDHFLSFYFDETQGFILNFLTHFSYLAFKNTPRCMIRSRISMENQSIRLSFQSLLSFLPSSLSFLILQSHLEFSSHCQIKIFRRVHVIENAIIRISSCIPLTFWVCLQVPLFTILPLQ